MIRSMQRRGRAGVVVAFLGLAAGCGGSPEPSSTAKVDAQAGKRRSEMKNFMDANPNAAKPK